MSLKLSLQARKGAAIFLVLVITMALAGLAGAAVLMTSGASLVQRYHLKERDLRYGADAALQWGISYVNNDPFALPTTGYTQVASNAVLTGADGSRVPNLVYDLYVGPTGAATRAHGRFATIVAVAKDTGAKRQFVRWVQLNQTNFAQYAYFSESEAGICRGSNFRAGGWFYTADDLCVQDGSKPALTADFMDSVWIGGTLTVGGSGAFSGTPPKLNADTFYKGYKTNQKAIPLPTNGKLAQLFSLAATGGTLFQSPNAATDSTDEVKSRIEFVAYDANADGDSIDANEGYLRYYITDPTTRTMGLPAGASAAMKDSAAVSYLRGGMTRMYDKNNCGEWHYVPDDNGKMEWEFFPFAVLVRSWMLTVDTVALNYQRAQGAGKPTDSTVILAEITRHMGTANYGSTTASPNPSAWYWFLDTLWYSGGALKAGIPASAAPRCYPGGDPHLAAVERDTTIKLKRAPGSPWRSHGPPASRAQYYYERGGVDSTFTDSTHSVMGHWWTSPFAGSIPGLIQTNHAETYKYLYPINTVVNPSFKGVVAVHGTVGISGNVDGNVTFYTDGTVGILDNLRITNSADTTCSQVMGIVAALNIKALDNGINVPQGDTVNRHQMRNGSSDLYIQSTLMALQAWGIEGLIADPATQTLSQQPWWLPQEQSGSNCGGGTWARGCLLLTGSDIQNIRQTVNSSGAAPHYDGGMGYAVQYIYNQCVIANPPPYFPVTGAFTVNTYYEAESPRFNVPALYTLLSP
jgi:hypothetical protein